MGEAMEEAMTCDLTDLSMIHLVSEFMLHLCQMVMNAAPNIVLRLNLQLHVYLNGKIPKKKRRMLGATAAADLGRWITFISISANNTLCLIFRAVIVTLLCSILHFFIHCILFAASVCPRRDFSAFINSRLFSHCQAPIYYKILKLKTMNTHKFFYKTIKNYQ